LVKPLAISPGRYSFLAVALVVCLVGLSGCGDGDTPTTADGTGTPTTASDKSTRPFVIYLWYDVDDTLSEDEMAETMEELEDIVRKRAEGFGAEVTDVSQPEPDQLAVDVSGMTLDEADELFAPAGLVDFREPERNEAGDIVCEDSGGNLFTVPGDKVPGAVGDLRAAYIVTDSHGNLTQCQGPADSAPRGSVTWTPAMGVGSDGVEKALTSRFVDPNSEVEFDGLGSPFVRFSLDAEGTILFEQITARLVGFPMAIAIDGEIISAPTVRTAIDGGTGIIAGLTEEEARTLVILLNSGPLPESADIRAVGERSEP
jgi:preprotein translocase subunit SecD